MTKEQEFLDVVEGLDATRTEQVIRLASRSKTDKEIAQILGIGVSTVATYWKRLRSRYEVRSRTEVVVVFLEALWAKERLTLEVELEGLRSLLEREDFNNRPR